MYEQRDCFDESSGNHFMKTSLHLQQTLEAGQPRQFVLSVSISHQSCSAIHSILNACEYGEAP